jgi:hypothetical protein
MTFLSSRLNSACQSLAFVLIACLSMAISLSNATADEPTAHTDSFPTIATPGQTDEQQNSSDAKRAKPESKLLERLERATTKATDEKYTLRYQFKKGDRYYWEVEHGVITETSIQGKKETSRSHSLATKKWEVTGVSKEGVATIVYSLVDVDMRHKVTDQPEVSYNSRTDTKVPEHYEHIAQAMGLGLATVEIADDGVIVRKQANYRDVDMGMGDFTIALPDQPVRVGHQWEEQSYISARGEAGLTKRILTRKVYELEKVSLGVATISMRTEILTPLRDPDIESQIVQKLTNGEIQFDIDAGRVMRRQFTWDESVQGFRVPDSLMVYKATMTETFIDDTARLRNQTVAVDNDRRKIKAPNDAPLLRR